MMTDTQTRAANRLVRKVMALEFHEIFIAQSARWLDKVKGRIGIILKNMPELAPEASEQLTRMKGMPANFDSAELRGGGVPATDAAIVWLVFIIAELERIAVTCSDFGADVRETKQDAANAAMRVLWASSELEKAIGTRRVRRVLQREASAAGVKAKKQKLADKQQAVSDAHQKLLAEGQGHWGMNRRISELTGVHEKTVSRILSRRTDAKG